MQKMNKIIKKVFATIAAVVFPALDSAASLTTSGEITVKIFREKTDCETAVSGMMYGMRLIREQELSGG